jgi:preprotein translocase SecE subunit
MTSGNAAAGASGGAGDSRDGGSRDGGARPDPGKPKPDYTAPRPAAPGSGFFTIYKKGQGYWTRMGTAAGAVLLGALTAYNLYVILQYLIQMESTVEGAARERQIAMGVAALFTAAFAFFGWRMMNKPSNVDFLIATDSEMKKVNWTSRKDLIGSTKVVIVFMFLIALILFLVDIVFSYFFYLIGVLKHSPFGGGGTIGGG